MSKEKFIYNKQTLQYEQIEVSWKEVGLKVFGFFCAILTTLALTFPLWRKLIPVDSQIQRKNQEIEQLVLKYDAMQKHVETMDKALSSLHNRSNGVYRKMFNMNPMDESRWLAGTGGHDKYADLAKFATDYKSSTVNTIISTDIKEGAKFKITGTPTFILDGKKIDNPRDQETFNKVIEEAIAKKATPTKQ